MKGIIIKGIAGFYYVKTEKEIIECKARGIFKNRDIVPIVGDLVEVEGIQNTERNTGIIDKIYPRKNQFIRPPVSNIDMFVMVVSCNSPAPNLVNLDRLLVMAEMHQVESIICINKEDIDRKDQIKNIVKIYEGVYDIVITDAIVGRGLDKLKEKIKGKKVAFAGSSGVGKSTIINHLFPKAEAETGEVSPKISRGKHTTRHVEIFSMEDGTMLYDTPGFTSFNILEANEDELQYFYPEFRGKMEMCKFDNCRHIKEPNCKIREAVDAGDINTSRYNSYIGQINEIKAKNKY